jgi:hypothetical protein
MDQGKCVSRQALESITIQPKQLGMQQVIVYLVELKGVNFIKFVDIGDGFTPHFVEKLPKI